MIFPLVSIIIVNYNGKYYLEKCLESLLKVNYANYEIIIVDNNSTDGSIEFLEDIYPQIKIKKLEKNLGFAEPSNIGAEMAKGKLLLFLNNDTITTPSFLDELVKAINGDPQVSICQSLLLRPDKTIDSSGDFIDIYGRAYSSKRKLSDISYILSARGACMMIKKDFFFKIGGFDKNFYVSFEDVDLGWRTWIMGYSVFIVPSSVVFHYKGKTIEKLPTLIQFHGAKNTLILRLTNFEIKFLIKSISVYTFSIIIKRIFGKSIIKDLEDSPTLPSTKIMFRAVFWIMKNWNYIIKKRKKINSLRKLSTNDLIKRKLITKI